MKHAADVLDNLGIKNEIKFEDFLHNLNNFNSRQLLTKLRVSDHNLEIELGRYKKIQREHRLCKVCKILDDEEHFFLHCQINSNVRHSLINAIKTHYPNFNQLDSNSKLKTILDPNKDILSSVVDYIKQSMELRK